MLLEYAPRSIQYSPPAPRRTVGDLLDQIAADDALCHDEAMRGPLQRALGAAAADGWSNGAAVVVLVRMLVEHTLVEPALRDRSF